MQQETARPVRISQEFCSNRRTPLGSFLILTRALEFLRRLAHFSSRTRQQKHPRSSRPQVSVSEKIERLLSFFSPSLHSHNMLKPTPASARSAIYRPPTWVNLWFVVSSPSPSLISKTRLTRFREQISTILVAWDIGFVLNRPRSFFGGDLHHFWS